MRRTEANMLREPFPANAIGSKPRGNTRIPFVGHAAVTERLLAVDPDWSWEPLALDGHGAPLILVNGEREVATLWIRLTVLGVSRIEVGSCSSKERNLEEVLVGSALRRAAMRFGVALDMWSKEELVGTLPDLAEVETKAAATIEPEDEGLPPVQEAMEVSPANSHDELVKRRPENIAFIRGKLTGKKPDVMRQLVEDCLPDAAKGQWNSLADLSAENLQKVRDTLAVMGA